jgi:hypothetical protein
MAALYHLTIGAWVLSCNIDFILKAAYCQLQLPKNVHIETIETYASPDIIMKLHGIIN